VSDRVSKPHKSGPMRPGDSALDCLARRRCSLAALVILAALSALGGCGERASAPSKLPEIAWFKGSMEQALAAATVQNKPLLVYWGAAWCPYCQTLKKTVFTRADFVEKTELFIPVYLDGDLPGAQAWGHTFKVTGYPTVLVLRPDHSEVARLSGGMDLSMYASLLDQALRDERPIQEVLTGAHGAEDCHRLAFYGWDADALGMDPTGLAAALKTSAARCHGTDQVRLELLALNMVLQSKASPATLKEPILSLFERLASAPSLHGSTDLLTGFDDSLYAAVNEQGPAFANKFRERYVARMREASDNPQLADSDRLIELASALEATQALSPDHAIPSALQEQARARVQTALAAQGDRFARNDIVNAAAIVYEALGDTEAAVQMYERELPNTRTPYYYMSHLAALAEKRGQRAEAIVWYAKAYEASQGPMTRVRWGSAYVRAMMRLIPDDVARIRVTALKVGAEMRAPDATAGHSGRVVDQLRKATERWATTPERRAVLTELVAHLPQEADAVAKAT
jgi:tetratricopeptide (TPR) repeat protein